VATSPLQRDPWNRVCRQFSSHSRAQCAICNSLFSRERVEFRIPSAKWNLSQSARANSFRNNTPITIVRWSTYFRKSLKCISNRPLFLVSENHQVHVSDLKSHFEYHSVYVSIWRCMSFHSPCTYLYVHMYSPCVTSCDRTGITQCSSPPREFNRKSIKVTWQLVAASMCCCYCLKQTQPAYSHRASMIASPWPIGQYHSDVYRKQSTDHL